MNNMSYYSAEQKQVIELFRNGLKKYIDKNIVLYGIGRNTDAIVGEVKEYNIMGLMDVSSTGQTVYGMKVLDESEVIKLKAIVVIVARDSVIPIIYSRIKHLKENGIIIVDYAGRCINESEKYENDFLEYWSITEDDLLKEIDKHKVISFDLFDTLIMRKILNPDNVFELVERVLPFDENKKRGFSKIRRKTGKELRGCPDINEIYKEMEKYGFDTKILEEGKKIEIDIEKKLLCQRKKMVEIFEYAVNTGKQVYIVSDMYLNKSIIENIVNSLGITGYLNILVSCEYGKSKESGELYRELKKESGSGQILHIGDNRIVDGELAEKEGIDSFLIYSAYDIFMASSMNKLLVDINSLEEKIILGLLAENLFNNPFVLSDSKGKVCINDFKLFGKAIIGPIMGEFVHWLVCQVNESKQDELLLPSRDGYLIKVLLDSLKCKKNFSYSYFKSSRRTVSVAATKNMADILGLLERKYNGTYGDFLYDRFGVEPCRDDDMRNKIIVWDRDYSSVKKYILSYAESILKNASKERDNYNKYLKKNNIMHGRSYAIFDFIAGGTVQHYLEKIIGNRLEGFYFATMNLPNRWFGVGDIKSAYGNICSYGGKSYIEKYYLLLEGIMTDENATLIRVEDSGEMVYEEKKNNNYKNIALIQAGIVDYVNEQDEIKRLMDDWKLSFEMSDKIFGQIFENGCVVSEDIKKSFENDDKYMGIKTYRMWSK